MNDVEKIALNGFRSPGTNGVEILEEKIAVPSQKGIAPSGAGQLTVGGGTGGVIVYLANAYVSSVELKNLLVYLSPTI